MAIFDRSYDRDYGYRGASGPPGDDRDMGDRMRQGWNRFKHQARDLVDRDDDRDYGYRGGAYRSPGYDRDLARRDYGRYGYGAGGNWQRAGYNRLEGENRDVYDRDSGWYAGRGMGIGGAWNYDSDYDREGRYGTSDLNVDYDRDYKSRWQTNHGDPFGDRASHTPIRVMRGEFSHPEEGRRGLGYDRDLARRGDMDRDRSYMHGIGYDPYEDRSRRGRRATRDLGYDRGWF